MITCIDQNEDSQNEMSFFFLLFMIMGKLFRPVLPKFTVRNPGRSKALEDYIYIFMLNCFSNVYFHNVCCCECLIGLDSHTFTFMIR